MSKKTTIRDVAKYAGVSHATVSYVINGVNKVSEETKLRVLQAIKELHYSPDFTAISLSKRKSNLIGIMSPLLNESLGSVMKENPYYTEMISGIELVARQNQFDILLTGIGKVEECKSWIQKRNLDGLLFLGRFPQKLYDSMRHVDVPIVLMDTYEEYTSIYPNVNIEDERGGYEATKHLIELGHRHIALVVTSKHSSPVDEQRLKGYERALKEAGIPVNPNIILESNAIYELENTFECGYYVGKAILQSKEPITAIFAVSDILSVGMMRALQTHGKRVPEDYSVIGFDDISISSYTVPSLTTVRQDVFHKGVTAAELLIQAMEGSSNPQHVELPVELIIRESTKRI